MWEAVFPMNDFVDAGCFDFIPGLEGHHYASNLTKHAIGLKRFTGHTRSMSTNVEENFHRKGLREYRAIVGSSCSGNRCPAFPNGTYIVTFVIFPTPIKTTCTVSSPYGKQSPSRGFTTFDSPSLR